MLDGVASKNTTDNTEGGDTSALSEHRGQSRITSAMNEKVTSVQIKEVPPSRCKMWSHHNRFYGLLNEASCADLIKSIRDQGQIQPAIVRKVDGDDAHDYEVICGARRHWVATRLAREIKIEVRDLTDEEAFLLSDAENRDREDISEYERAIEYRDALKLYYGGRQSEMAPKLGMNQGHLSKYIALADLPEEVVSAYPDPRWIAIRHAGKLRPLMKDSKLREKIIKAAESMSKVEEGKRPANGNDVLTALLEATQKVKAETPKPKVIEIKSKAGKKMLKAITAANGEKTFLLSSNSNASKEEILEAIGGLL
ncbi:hypothetical protein BOW53_16105 [Solemya pervernicosa gill symbiont]|uniref:ParB-like N-terminal domain-containing protein n=1 Tax=Solemya pervernicosa gill symbiont TaxID=642797 RepID=A0A1T2KZW6_9GAMM|nr:hypothetical protein BOW53_16105 [Solemya pervernicosa gill symbiont]